MTDARIDGNERNEYDREENLREREDDRLPWLEAAEEEERGPSPIKLIGALIVGLLAIGVIVGGLFWLGNRSGATNGNGEIIAAPDGPYKVAPDDPGGMQLDNRGTSQVAASAGAETNASIDRGAATEAPVTGGGAQTPAAPPTAAQPKADTPAARPGAGDTMTRPGGSGGAAAARPAQAAGGNQPRLSGPLIQVGAFPSEAVAQAEWTRLGQRFPYLRGLQHNVVTYQAGNQTFYRLRAGGDDARGICARLRSARQPCYDVPQGQ